MRARWPSLRVTRIGQRAARWQGELKPLLRSYEVRVDYRAPTIIERIDSFQQQPRVRVIAPPLKPRPGSSEGALPHVYWDDDALPALCLFDHETNEWTPFHLLADTTIPWALDWLTCYEGWRATGEWTGGGRHAPSPPTQEISP